MQEVALVGADHFFRGNELANYFLFSKVVKIIFKIISMCNI